MPNRLPTSPSPSRRPRVRIIPYNYIRFGTTPSGLEIEIKLSCFYTDGRERERMEGRKRWADTKTERARRSKTSGRDFSRVFSRDEPTTVFCSRELRLRLPALSSCFSACPIPKSARLNLPWNFGALPPALCKGLYRGVGRSSCSSTYPEIRCLYYAPNFVFSAVNFDRAISDLIDLSAILRAYYPSLINLMINLCDDANFA